MPTQQQKNSITAGMMMHGAATSGVCVGISSHQELERSLIRKGAFLHGDAFPSRPMKKASEESPTLDEIKERILALKKKLDDLKNSQQAGGGE